LTGPQFWTSGPSAGHCERWGCGASVGEGGNGGIFCAPSGCGELLRIDQASGESCSLVGEDWSAAGNGGEQASRGGLYWGAVATASSSSSGGGKGGGMVVFLPKAARCVLLFDCSSLGGALIGDDLGPGKKYLGGALAVTPCRAAGADGGDAAGFRTPAAAAAVAKQQDGQHNHSGIVYAQPAWGARVLRVDTAMRTTKELDVASPHGATPLEPAGLITTAACA